MDSCIVNKVDYDFLDSCSSLCDAARKIFGRDNFRDCEKVKNICKECNFDWGVWKKRCEKKYKEVVCLCCGKTFNVPVNTNRKFCSSSCSATFNNKNRTKEKNCINCGKKLGPNGVKYCSSSCQSDFQYKNYIEKWKNGKENGIRGVNDISIFIRRYLFLKNDNRCEKCGWNQVNPITQKIPLQIHHIDGNCQNNKEENLQLLCPNCHSITDNYGVLNKKSTRKRK